MRTYGRLREAIKEKFGKRVDFADALGIDPSSLSKKLNSKVPWTQYEIEDSCRLLEIPLERVADYFFYD